jgi:hypothetical protein
VENDEEEAMEIADDTKTIKQRPVYGGIFEAERTNIDWVVDAHSSLLIHVLIFLFFLLK